MSWTAEHSETTEVAPEAIWAQWSDVGTWPAWDAGLDRVTLDGPFAAGTSGTIKPKGGPTFNLRLLEVRPGEGYADETRLPLARMRFEHTATREGELTRVTYRVEITGPAAPLFSRVIGRGIARDFPATIGALIREAGAVA